MLADNGRVYGKGMSSLKNHASEDTYGCASKLLSELNELWPSHFRIANTSSDVDIIFGPNDSNLGSVTKICKEIMSKKKTSVTFRVNNNSFFEKPE